LSVGRHRHCCCCICSCRNIINFILSSSVCYLKCICASICFYLFNILFKTEIILLHIYRMRHPYISVSICASAVTGYRSLILWKSKNKAVICRIFVKPAIIYSLGILRRVIIRIAVLRENSDIKGSCCMKIRISAGYCSLCVIISVILLLKSSVACYNLKISI